MQRDQVAPLPHGDHGRVRPTSRRVHADHHRGCLVLVARALRGCRDDCRVDELVVTHAGELTIHLNAGLRGVFAVLLNDLLIYLFVSILDRPRVNLPNAPEVTLGMEALEEVPAIAPGVAEREPVPIQDVLGEEPRPD